jgi:hypothetical protein
MEQKTFQEGFKRAKRCITQPEMGEFKGNMTISIPVGKDGEAFTFGYQKGKAIQKYFTEIDQFVKESEKKYGGK